MALTFTYSIYLWLLLSIPLLVIIHFVTMRAVKSKALKFANFEAISRVTGRQIIPNNIGLLIMRIAIILLVVLAISRTTVSYVGQESDFNFVIAIDASSSMTATDIEPNRLEAAKEEALNFISSISGKSKIGAISFSGSSFIRQGLSDDLILVRNAISKMNIETIGGTDLGEAIVTSTNLLLQGEKAKVLILLTDGRSNVGVPLEDAIEYASLNDVIVYTIGIGTEEGGKIAGLEAISRLDEESLKTIAISTGGKYFAARDKESLRNAYNEIASSTKKRISTELTALFTLLILILLILEWALANSKYRILP